MRTAKKFYASRNATVVARRVNDARSQLTELERQQLRKPPKEVTFRGLTSANDGGTARTRTPSGPVLVASAVGVTGRLGPTSLTVGADEK